MASFTAIILYESMAYFHTKAEWHILFQVGQLQTAVAKIQKDISSLQTNLQVPGSFYSIQKYFKMHFCRQYRRTLQCSIIFLCYVLIHFSRFCANVSEIILWKIINFIQAIRFSIEDLYSLF
jgi:hypothetical protein